MRRPVAPLPFLLASLVGGCTCGAKPSSPARVDAAGAGSAVASASAAPGESSPTSASLAVFSAPIAAARVAHGDVVAGLVAAENVVRVTGLGDGGVSWTADALRGVAWSADADLRLQPTGEGVAVVWRGVRDGKSGRTLVLLGAHGEPHGAPVDIGPAVCATGDGMAWIDAHRGGASHVLARRWADDAAAQALTVPADREPGLVCGDHTVIVLGDGDDDLTAAAFLPGAAPDSSAKPPIVAIRSADFGEDDEREHRAYSVGDDLGLVRVGESGAIALREWPRGGAPTAWRRLKHSLPADDDVVAVDGDAGSTVIVSTHDADDACPGVAANAVSVHALRVDRGTGAEAALDLAPADCDRSLGPFWLADAPGAPVVAWVERDAKRAANAAPVAALAYRLLRPDGVREGRIEQPADAMVDGGCDDRGCFAAALVRPPGGDGMQPEAIRVMPYGAP